MQPPALGQLPYLPQPGESPRAREGSCRHTPSSKSPNCSTSGRDKVYYLLRTKQLGSIEIGKLRRVTDTQLAEFLAALESAGAAGCRSIFPLPDCRMSCSTLGQVRLAWRAGGVPLKKAVEKVLTKARTRRRDACLAPLDMRHGGFT